jgi:hypothetical protein
MATPPTLSPRLQLARAVRERFLAEMVKAMTELSVQVQMRLTELVDEPSSARDSQTRRDVWMAYKKCRPLWLENTVKVWRACLEPVQAKKAKNSLESAGLELVGTDVVENKILASRLVMTVNDKVLVQLDDVRVRIKLLESLDDLDSRDLLRPEVLVLQMVEQWTHSGLPGDSWPLVNDTVQAKLITCLNEAYKNANTLLISKGVLPTIELKDRVRSPVRAAGSRPPPARPTAPPTASQAHAQDPQSGAVGDTGQGGYSQNSAHSSHTGSGGALPSGGGQPGQSAPMPMSGQAPQRAGGFFGGRLGWGNTGASETASGPAPSPASNGPNGLNSPSGTPSNGPKASPRASAPAPFWKQSGPGSNGAELQHYGAGAETRMMTHNTPLQRARTRAQGVIGQIKRLFVNHAGGEFVPTAHYVPSPALARAITHQAVAASYATGGTMYEDYSPAGVVRVANDLREKTAELKKKAETKGEKATIEIVALMFQAILAEERIPPGIRVWFARLQMPVLRVALEDPDFFGTTDHPARMLIDRMGSCVMGFDATGVQSSAMETEVKRIVQVVEQYPETGKKVYQIVYDEFQKFLSKFLTEKGPTQRVVSVAQQVEQKETLAIQFTIEMRNMLKDLPVRDEIREFLFKTWAEVLAVSALRKGPKHEDTLTLKKSATDLIWAASAKPNRADRARVIQELPNLLVRLRSGMTLLGMAPSEQEVNVKKISDTLADAFLSKTQAIPQEKIDAMAQRLGSLEDFVSEDGMGDLPLDAESIEMMLGIESSAIEVVVNGGSKPTAAMLAWAQELQVGSWFTLDHNNQISQVQFAWRSERKHLNLFASTSGKSFLVQGGRLAAYLQAGLLLPQEEEALTVRATRDAMAKLEANPERLLA